MTIPSRCLACPVQAMSLCGAIGDDAATALAAITYRMRVPPGRTIYAAAQPGRSFAIIISGVVKLVMARPDGCQQIVGLQFPSDFVGRPLTDSSSVSAEAATMLELCCVSGRAFEGLMREYPGIGRALLRRLMTDLDQAREWAFLLGRATAQEKVATLLKALADRIAKPIACSRAAQPRPVAFALPLSRMEMAECLGLRLETVCRQLAELKAQGVIALSGRRHFEVLDMAALTERTANPPTLATAAPATSEI